MRPAHRRRPLKPPPRQSRRQRRRDPRPCDRRRLRPDPPRHLGLRRRAPVRRRPLAPHRPGQLPHHRARRPVAMNRRSISAPWPRARAVPARPGPARRRVNRASAAPARPRGPRSRPSSTRLTRTGLSRSATALAWRVCAFRSMFRCLPTVGLREGRRSSIHSPTLFIARLRMGYCGRSARPAPSMSRQASREATIAPPSARRGPAEIDSEAAHAGAVSYSKMDASPSRQVGYRGRHPSSALARAFEMRLESR